MTAPLAINHHADHPGFSGVGGLLAALTMVVGRGPLVRLVADLGSVGPGDHVVDIGAGPGSAVREALRRGARVTAVDPAAVMLRLGRALTRDRAGRVAWADGVAERVPLDDGAATVYWSVMTVHHWTDPAAGVAEAARVLAPGGRLVVAERRVRHGAKGLASHGWVREQAEAFAGELRGAGFADVAVGDHHAGRMPVLTVRATRP